LSFIAAAVFTQPESQRAHHMTLIILTEILRDIPTLSKLLKCCFTSAASSLAAHQHGIYIGNQAWKTNIKQTLQLVVVVLFPSHGFFIRKITSTRQSSLKKKMIKKIIINS